MLLKLFIRSSSLSSDVLYAPASDSAGSAGSGTKAGARSSTQSLSVVPVAAAQATRFPPASMLNGDLNADEDVVIDGLVTGTIDMPGHALTIGPGAEVDARVLARDVTIYGTLRGKVTALEILDIRPGARVSGEFAAPAVALAEGAQVQGRVETKRVDAAMHVARYRMKSAQR
jgi:cytoskeletal protein CcmA (bactofilin family)